MVSLLVVLMVGEVCAFQQRTVLPDTLKSFTVSNADEWTDYFYRKSGWFGADGVFSFRLDGKEVPATRDERVLMTFSDTMTGEVTGDTVLNFKMVNNSVAWLNGAEDDPDIQLTHLKSGEPGNFFSPETPDSQPGDYYWLGDGYVDREHGDKLILFGYRVFDKSDASWDFEVRGTTMISIPIRGDTLVFEQQQQVDTPLFFTDNQGGTATFGSGVYVNTAWAGAPEPDGYIYVYGLHDPGKRMLVARVEPGEIQNWSEWRFWDGNSWSTEITDSRPVTDRVSNELSLTPISENRYLLIFQEDGIGEYTSARVGTSPVGPFGPLQRLRKVPELIEPPGIIPYNAKAHPVLSTPDRVLISYNTITLDYFNDILNYPHSYRPRFFWLDIGE